MRIKNKKKEDKTTTTTPLPYLHWSNVQPMEG
jgi:hypothetical protein